MLLEPTTLAYPPSRRMAAHADGPCWRRCRRSHGWPPDAAFCDGPVAIMVGIGGWDSVGRSFETSTRDASINFTTRA